MNGTALAPNAELDLTMTSYSNLAAGDENLIKDYAFMTGDEVANKGSLTFAIEVPDNYPFKLEFTANSPACQYCGECGGYCTGKAGIADQGSESFSQTVKAGATFTVIRDQPKSMCTCEDACRIGDPGGAGSGGMSSGGNGGTGATGGSGGAETAGAGGASEGGMSAGGSGGANVGGISGGGSSTGGTGGTGTGGTGGTGTGGSGGTSNGGTSGAAGGGAANGGSGGMSHVDPVCGVAMHVVGGFATWCGKVNVHTTGNGWESDGDCVSGCNIGGLGYCQKFWSDATAEVQLPQTTPDLKTFQDRGCASAYPSRGLAQYACCAPDEP